MATKQNNSSSKSVFWAFFFWVFGGVFGMHHLYLRRYRHAFVWGTTFGGFLLGWFSDLSKIRRYVHEYNRDRKVIKQWMARISKYEKPPFSVNRFISMLLVGYSWGHLMLLAVPTEEIWGINPKYLNVLSSLGVALGVWTVGNIGQEKGKLTSPLIAAVCAYPLRYVIYDDTWTLLTMTAISALAFDRYSKNWRSPLTKDETWTIKKVFVLCLCVMLYLSLWSSYIYFHGAVIDIDGEEVPIKDALHDMFTARWWSEIYQGFWEMYQFAQVHGWHEVWRQIMESSEPFDQRNALEVLGLGPDATESEIRATWRKLSREHHPDKIKNEDLRPAAQDRFLEIQKAYEVLSSKKQKRYRRNKKDHTAHDL